MIVGHRALFLQRVTQRGYTLAEVAACIVAEDGDTITVDETHPAYPREPKPGCAAPRLPPIAERLANFARSAVSHVVGGARLCSQEEIDARYAICQSCEHFSAGACAHCGCPLVRERQYISKLAWAGEACPVGKWPAANRH